MGFGSRSVLKFEPPSTSLDFLTTQKFWQVVSQYFQWEEENKSFFGCNCIVPSPPYQSAISSIKVMLIWKNNWCLFLSPGSLSFFLLWFYFCLLFGNPRYLFFFSDSSLSLSPSCIDSLSCNWLISKLSWVLSPVTIERVLIHVQLSSTYMNRINLTSGQWKRSIVGGRRSRGRKDLLFSYPTR